MKSFSEMTIALASDHAGYGLKHAIQLFLEDNGAKVKDFGCYSTDSCDYPDYAHPMSEAVEKGEYEFGIAICSALRCAGKLNWHPSHVCTTTRTCSVCLPAISA